MRFKKERSIQKERERERRDREAERDGLDLEVIPMPKIDP